MLKIHIFIFLASSLRLFGSLDPLPSWNPGPAKTSIIEFIKATCDESSPNYVPPGKRFATFDQDGTLWVEHPLYTQAVYCLDRILELSIKAPKLSVVEPFKTLIDQSKSENLTFRALEKAINFASSGMSVEQYQYDVIRWLEKAKHPRWEKPYTELIYQPMLEVIQYFQANGYQTYIVTGGGQDFLRAYSEKTYNIPTEKICGTIGETEFKYGKNGKPVLIKKLNILLRDNFSGKPEGIHLMIGQRPHAAFGNSNGDQQMLEYTAGGDGSRLMMLVLHDDAIREYAYGPAENLPNTLVGTFSQALYNEAKQSGWIVISMKKDWNKIFSFD